MSTYWVIFVDVMDDEIEREQQNEPTDRLLQARYYGLLILIACALGLLIASLLLSLFKMY
ncbi:hypothetical protein IRY61_01610 [Candidatus Saccharibacteria bacterium]|nr:hypothetical protein [Candidatus Saccharibacteria bacterium]